MRKMFLDWKNKVKILKKNIHEQEKNDLEEINKDIQKDIQKEIKRKKIEKEFRINHEELYDYGYIHYTYETKWYGKLGYKTVLSWNGKGFVS